MNRKRVTAIVLAGTLICSPIFSIADGIIAHAADNRFNGEEWYDQIETVEINREPAHATFTPYEDAGQALAAEQTVFDSVDETSSPYYQTLNGDWSFKFAQRPADREKQVFGGEETAAYEENWDTEGWDTIKVPSTIQAQRDENGDFKYEKPLYVNQIYPWANYEAVDYNTNGTNKPVAPTVNNSVGQYKRTFTVPEDWDGRQVFVSFQGVESAFYLYINGQRVGYAEDSYTVDEFNITDYLQPGENTIAVEVYRWSTGSYLENQDFIRLSGIFRDVYLYSKNDVELRDRWDAYAAAALEGKDKIDSADQAEIDAAAATMKAAREALVSLTGLKDAYEKYSAYDPAVYTEESYQAMKTALADAENVLADPAASNEDVTAAIDALEKAEAGIVTVTDAYRAELLQLVQAFEAKNEEDYSAASWTAYETLAEEARVLMNDPDAAAEDMKDMIDELAAVEEALVYTAGLRDAAAGYADKDQVNYTVDSWKPVEEARVLMRRTLDPGDPVSQTEVDEALKALEAAELIDVSELKQIIAEAEKAQKEDYEEDAWNTLQGLITKIKEEVLVSGTAEEVEKATADLSAALADVKDDEPEEPDKPDPLPPEEIPGGGTGSNGSGQGGADGGHAGSGSGAGSATKTGDQTAGILWISVAGLLLAAAAAAVAARKIRS